MKIAVISDIHGNMEALEAVMEDIKSCGCEKIFVLGDYAMAGPEPYEAIDYFAKYQLDSNYKMIQGNTDLMIANYSDDDYEYLKKKAPVMAEAMKHDFFGINHVQRSFLKNLPIQLEVEEDGVKILLVHGSPRRNNEDILPDTPIEEVEKMLVNVDADVVLCGHTHIPCGFQTRNKKTVVNAGSVGRPFTPEPKACYLIMTIEHGRYAFEHRFVKYDKEKAAQKLRKRGFEGSDKLAATLLNPKERHF